MEKYREELVKLLSAAIRGQDVDEFDCVGVDWERICEEAKAHEVHTFIYPMVKNLIDDQLNKKLRKMVLISEAYQIQHIYRIIEVLKKFNSSGIPIIVLKGVAVMELYTNPQHRTMGDSDILVRNDDLERAKALLIEMGYCMENYDYKHIHFSYNGNFPIELHRYSINYKKMDKLPYLEDLLWENAVHSTVCGIPVLKLYPQDEILHLCLHMISHMKSTGFGLRQLCDLVLYVEKRRDEIDWATFFDRCRTYGVYEFVNAIFVVCRRLLKLELSHPIDNTIYENEHYIEMFIDYIFDGGAYGRRVWERKIVSNLMYMALDKKKNRLGSRLYNNFCFIFPSPSKLSYKYSYAKKYPGLLVIAWVHRFIHFIIRKDLSLSQKRSYIITTETIKSVKEEETKLFDWLQLP